MSGCSDKCILSKKRTRAGSVTVQEQCLTAVAPKQTFFCSAVVDCLAHLVFRSEVIYLGDSLPFLNIEGSERKWTCGQKRNPPDVKAMAPAQAGIKVADVAECILIPAVPTQLGMSKLHHQNCWVQLSLRFSSTADCAVARQAIFMFRPWSDSCFGVSDSVRPVLIASCSYFLVYLKTFLCLLNRSGAVILMRLRGTMISVQYDLLFDTIPVPSTILGYAPESSSSLCIWQKRILAERGAAIWGKESAFCCILQNILLPAG